MPPGAPKPKVDSTPATGVRGAGTGKRDTHVHFWADASPTEGQYTEELCSGEKWSPFSKDHVFPKGCGARRRILKTVFARDPAVHPLDAYYPPDSAWEMVDPGKG